MVPNKKPTARQQQVSVCVGGERRFERESALRGEQQQQAWRATPPTPPLSHARTHPATL